MENLNKLTAQKLKELKLTLPLVILEKQLELQPTLKEHYTDRHRRQYLENTGYHFIYLAEAIAFGEPALFIEYLSWFKTFFASRHIDSHDIILNLQLFRDTLKANLEPEYWTLVTRYIDAGIEKYASHITPPPSFILESNPLNEQANNYLKYLVKGDKSSAYKLIMELLSAGAVIKDIYLSIFQVTQQETGRLWQMGKISIAQEHYITAATQLIMSQLYPYLFDSAHNGKKIIVSCITGELHEIGARMVADLFEMDGWNSYYFGANIEQSSLITATENYLPEVLAVSVTMTFNLTAVSELIGKIKMNTKINHVKILVGGYPFNLTRKLWKNIGADGFASDAAGAVELANSFLSK